MDITRQTDERVVVTDEGRTFLGIRTGIAAQGFGAQRVSAVARRGGTLIANDRFESWPVERLVESDGRFYLCGPPREGRTVAELLADGTIDAAGWLPHLLEAIKSALVHDDLELCNIATSLVTDDGRVLFFDTELASAINTNLPLDERRRVYSPYRYDTLRGTDERIYHALTIAYHALTGAPVCPPDEEDAGDTAAECHSSSFVKRPMRFHNPALRADICTAVEGGLARSEHRTPELLSEIATILRSGSAVESIDSREADGRRTAAREVVEANRVRTRRRTFWRKRGMTVLVASIALLIVGIVPYRIIAGRLEPPATVGMGPREVARTFYDAWNDLDHLLMEDTLADGVGREVVREVTNVYVIDRVQTAHTWESLLIRADEWLGAGRPAGRMPYGVAGLELRLVTEGAETATVHARYDVWRPESVDTPDGTAATVAVRMSVSERLVLARGRHSWEIAEIRTSVNDDGERVPINLQ